MTLENINNKLVLEKNRTKTLLTEKEIVHYIKSALTKEPRIMLKLLIKEIVLYDDHVEIYYRHTDRLKPDEQNTRQAFSFYHDKIDNFSINNTIFTLNIEIICFI